MNINNIVAIVTGGTGGLGRHIVDRFAEQDMKIYIPVRSMNKFCQVFDRSQSSDIIKLPKIYAMECDVNATKQVEEFISNVIKLAGKVDILINTIGGYHPKILLSDMNEDLISEQLKLNLMTTFRFTKTCLKYMCEQKYGRIISVGTKAVIDTSPGKFAYEYSKYGVMHMMSTVNIEHNTDKILAWTLMPTIIDTPLNREGMQNADYDSWIKPQTIARKCLELIGSDELGEEQIFF